MKKLALLLILAPLVLPACGGGSSSTRTKIDPVAYVKRAAAKTAAKPSEHMVMDATVSAGPTAITMNGSGDFSNAMKTGQISFVMSLMGQKVRMEEILAGTTIYIRSPMFAGSLPKGKTWAKMDMQKVDNPAGLNYSSLMSQSPTQTLDRLKAAGSVKSLGSETIGGVETTRYQVTDLDLSKLPQGSKITALGVHPKFGPIDVWIGNSDHYVYRETMSVAYSVAGQEASANFTINLSKFGEPVHVTVPRARETFDITDLASAGA